MTRTGLVIDIVGDNPRRASVTLTSAQLPSRSSVDWKRDGAKLVLVTSRASWCARMLELWAIFSCMANAAGLCLHHGRHLLTVSSLPVPTVPVRPRHHHLQLPVNCGFRLVASALPKISMGVLSDNVNARRRRQKAESSGTSATAAPQ